MISIIVPVHNAALYLTGCIDSVLGQGYENFELLLVDDGSTDGSLAICEEYAEKDSRIRVFHQENQGVSAARNKGLDRIQGEWFCFLDADDEWMEGGLRALTEGISEDVDWIMAGYETYDDDGNQVYAVPERVSRTFSSEEALLQLFKPDHYHYLGYVWAKLFRSSVVRTGGCRFAEDISFCEDKLFTVQFACASPRPVFYTTRPVYRYRMHPGSVMDTLERSFNPRFESDLEASIRIRASIRTAFPGSRELCKAADRSVYGSFRKIAGMIARFASPDASLERRLRKKTTDCIGFPAYCILELKRRLWKGWKSFCR